MTIRAAELRQWNGAQEGTEGGIYGNRQVLGEKNQGFATTRYLGIREMKL